MNELEQLAAVFCFGAILGVVLSSFIFYIVFLSSSNSYTLYIEKGGIYQNGLSKEVCELINTKFKLNGLCVGE